MKIGVIGSGDVGQVLARGFKEAGHEVMIGTRDASKLAAFSSASGVPIGRFHEVAQFGEIVILGVHGAAMDEVIKLAGSAAAFEGKIVIDPSNPLDFSGGMPPKLFVGTTDSLGERVQRELPGAKVVKAFNTMGNGRMILPQFESGTPVHLIAGEDSEAKATVTRLLNTVGWSDVQDLGGISSSRWLEALCLTWCMVMIQNGTQDHAFSLLRS